MTSETEYFAVLWDGDDNDRPRAVIRRRGTPDGMEEEILRADGTWESTGILALVRLNMYEKDVQPITPTAALDFERRVLSRHADEA
ncbi:hypothetical protein [Cellulomonas sp. SLBN-39]|uniref:hypothetical protein n=1 Tax=Cellulomonas sp. SLBN-39 TaxID=2768446 RepID=UPI00114F145A|nr:hypothetical protein [Cellulomonas sp. SLBN-39]TQL02661.1 hypothetical protein FBY24_1741 [Cellulomonas sp. SLBN-39]